MNSHSLNRRQFSALATSLATAAITRHSYCHAEAPAAPSIQIAFLSDTHIAGDEATEARGIQMASHLTRVVKDCLEQLTAASHVIVNGDCAYLKGQPDDYKTFAKLIQPLKEAGHTVHVTMGNHDDRAPLYSAMHDHEEQDVAVDDKHVGLISFPSVDLVLLDSLWEVNVVTGRFGQEQREWLANFLDTGSTKPVIVIGHHNLQRDKVAKGGKPGGLADTQPFQKLLLEHPRVRAYFYGHTHRWSIDPLVQETGSDANRPSGELTLVNLPAVAYVFDAKQPSGWVLGSLGSDSLRLKLNTLDEAHEKSGDTAEIGLAV